MSNPKILIFAPREEPASFIEQLEAAGCEIAIGNPDWQLPRGHYEDAFASAARNVVALMGTSIRHTPVSRRIMEGSQRLRIVAKYTVGVDDVDIDAATELGILVCHSPTENNCFSVAETAVAMILTVLKKVRERDADVRAGKWRGPHHGAFYVGTRVAQLMAPWRIRVLAYDPHIPPAQFLLANAKPVDYDTLLRESDIISY